MKVEVNGYELDLSEDEVREYVVRLTDTYEALWEVVRAQNITIDNLRSEIEANFSLSGAEVYKDRKYKELSKYVSTLLINHRIEDDRMPWEKEDHQ